MTAPSRPPSFFDQLAGRDTPQPDALREPGFLLDSLANDATLWPDWLLDDDSQRRIVLRLVEHVREQRAVIGFSLDKLSGTVTAMPDPSGYLRIEVEIDGASVLTAYLERIWEEHELWPPDVSANPGDEAPGRLGKHRSWVSISATGWPVLAGVANENGWLNLRQLDDSQPT